MKFLVLASLLVVAAMKYQPEQSRVMLRVDLVISRLPPPPTLTSWPWSRSHGTCQYLDAPKYPGSRIVNGNQASRGQFPHQAALYLDGRSFCGGSLISTSWILTAAHCTLNIGTVTAHLGAQSLNSVESGRVTLATRNLINHASYNPSNLNNDISLVRLPSAVALNAFIQLVHLPRHSQASTTYAGVASQVSGWGRNSDSATGVSNNLNFVNLNIITNAVCAQTYGTAVIIGSTLCASGAGGRSTCNSVLLPLFPLLTLLTLVVVSFQGDSGGPLVLNQASGYLQIGVVSFVSGAGCASGNPSGYVRTGHFLSWISANTGIHIAN
uniref:Peptidase S1 domain-containing protein n=1 Tax=Timema cristinae TaxID=61476 RepID=A0A7R9H317_TIMCR|nr:unnamed protein product [Timema cristinae]